MTQPHSPVSSPELGSPSPEARGDIRLRLFARTDVGQVREHNEDNFLVADLSRRSRGLLEANRVTSVGPHGDVFAVCDGMGGAAAGEIASQLAVDILCEKMVEGLDGTPFLRRDELGRRLVRAIEAAGLRIFQDAKVDRSRRGMGTTVTAAALVDDVLFLGQVGDSRGYVLRNGALTQVTRDQSLVNQLIEAGQLTEEEAETFEHNNIILQALGTGDSVQVDLTYVELRRGDMLLLCSDGLSGMVRFDEIREVLCSSTEPVEICKALTDRANQAGGHDNITVIIVVFDGEGLRAVTPDLEPLRYRKYMLSDETLDPTESHRRQSVREALTVNPSHLATPIPGGPPPNLYAAPVISEAPGDPRLGVNAPSHRPSAGPRGISAPPFSWHEQGPHASLDDDATMVPGARVPAWVVLVLVLGVLTLLAATAFLLLR